MTRILCPRCGAETDDSSLYCINCGYSTRRGLKPSTERWVILAVLLIGVALLVWRYAIG